MGSVHEHDQYTNDEGTKFTVMGPRILVRADKPPEMSSSGLIVMPNGAMEHALNTGTILAFGTRIIKETGDKVPLDELEVGLKCLFVRFLAKMDSNQRVQHTLGKDVIVLQPSDIMLVYTPDEHNKLFR